MTKKNATKLKLLKDKSETLKVKTRIKAGLKIDKNGGG
jgi:hypothetical protein